MCVCVGGAYARVLAVLKNYVFWEIPSKYKVLQSHYTPINQVFSSLLIHITGSVEELILFMLYFT